MSQHCRANPCCGDLPCSGIPLPQDASGLPAHNKSTWWRTDIKGVPAYTSSYFNKERWEAEGKTVTRVTDEDRSALSTSQSDPAPELAVLRAENERLRQIKDAAKYYLASVNGGPGPLASDVAWASYDDTKQKAFDVLRAALSSQEGSE
ncbi:hypothetical protein G6L12_08080 [Agrobacterium rhizogenes]|nr:hypothetical protein [Rhizobium rhizogenes]NTF74430.1 hypothetical protein [Rhizobium rhizogenes]